VPETSTSPPPAAAATRAPTLIDDSSHLSLVELALPNVNADPRLEAEAADAAHDCLGAADGACGSVERREEAVAGGVAFRTAEAAELSAHKRVVLGE
jgi:hypothetical protein